jgi:hypothetical protein
MICDKETTDTSDKIWHDYLYKEWLARKIDKSEPQSYKRIYSSLKKVYLNKFSLEKA